MARKNTLDEMFDDLADPTPEQLAQLNTVDRCTQVLDYLGIIGVVPPGRDIVLSSSQAQGLALVLDTVRAALNETSDVLGTSDPDDPSSGQDRSVSIEPMSL